MLEGYRTIIAAAVALTAEILRLWGIEIDVGGLTNSVVILLGTGAAIGFKLAANRRKKNG